MTTSDEWTGMLVPTGDGGWTVNRDFLTPERLEILERFKQRREDEMSNDRLMVKAAKQYLEGLGVTLWGDWDISKPEGIEKAAAWLANRTEAVLGLYDDLLYSSYDDDLCMECLSTCLSCDTRVDQAYLHSVNEGDVK